ncbi:MAG TPA: IPT/TIG domain-containing protein, partial [Candidatus Acidoferrales bacterium]|nr:IPT/TIG domain-containing protein [Candidatus Acidoferrales bacterium]
SCVFLEDNAGTSNAVLDLVDVHTGRLRERVFLTQVVLSSIFGPGALKAIALTPAGDQIFLATTAGLTVVQMDSVPLGIGSVTPASGPAGTAVTIRGTGFAAGTSVIVNGVAAAVSFVDSSTLSVVLPGSLSTGAAQFVLHNPDGSSYALDAAFTVH